MRGALHGLGCLANAVHVSSSSLRMRGLLTNRSHTHLPGQGSQEAMNSRWLKLHFKLLVFASLSSREHQFQVWV
jgi:hypothetical protein